MTAACLCLAALATPPLTPAQELRRTPIVDVFNATRSAVVNIASTRTVQQRRSPFELLFDDWEPFFRPMQRQLTSVGTGFIIHPSGYVITNTHVVERTSDTKVIFDDDTTFDAMVVASDPESDLALLKVSAPHPLPVIALGRSDDLLIGETVVAIGNPLGYQHTLTTGVISAIHRELDMFNERTGRTVRYEDLIQTDASINPGNSGGPLLNVLGELIGINTAIRGDAQNIGFAIPVERLQRILPNMLSIEQQARFALGIEFRADGVVSAVADGSPAERSGLRVGDRITAVDDRTVASALEIAFALLEHDAGDRVRFGLTAPDMEPRTVIARLQPPPTPDGQRLAQEKLGVTLEALPEALQRELHLHRQGGLLISAVERNGPAHRIGILPGDVLTVFDRYYVTSLEEAGQLLEQTRSGQRVGIRILRIEGDIIFRDSAMLTLR